MNREEKLIKEYLNSELNLDRTDRTSDCPNEDVLLKYATGVLSQEQHQLIGHHIAGCGFCLSQLSLAAQSQSMDEQSRLSSVSDTLLNKTKTSKLHTRCQPRARLKKFFLQNRLSN